LKPSARGFPQAEFPIEKDLSEVVRLRRRKEQQRIKCTQKILPPVLMAQSISGNRCKLNCLIRELIRVLLDRVEIKEDSEEPFVCDL